MAWCEAEPVHMMFSAWRATRGWEAEIAALMAAAQREHQKTQQAAPRVRRVLLSDAQQLGLAPAAWWPRPSISTKAPTRASW